MKLVAIYTRVSSDRQKEEGTLAEEPRVREPGLQVDEDALEEVMRGRLGHVHVHGAVLVVPGQAHGEFDHLLQAYGGSGKAAIDPGSDPNGREHEEGRGSGGDYRSRISINPWMSSWKKVTTRSPFTNPAKPHPPAARATPFSGTTRLPQRSQARLS